MTDDQEPMDDEDVEEGAEGGEGEDGEGGEGEGNSGSSKLPMDPKKLILFVVLPVLVLAGIGGGLFFSGILDPLFAGGGKEEAHSEKPKDDGHGEKADGHGAEAGAAFLEIPTMIVNLNTEDGTPRYLRLSVQLELENAEDKAAVEAVIPRVIDQFQTYLRELRVRDLRGSAGIYRLQMELLWRVNKAAAPTEVKDVLFQEILIQ